MNVIVADDILRLSHAMMNLILSALSVLVRAVYRAISVLCKQVISSLGARTS